MLLFNGQSLKVLSLVGLLILTSCATSGDKDEDNIKADSRGGDSKIEDNSSSGGGGVSAERNTFTNSWSNNQLTSHTINASKAEQQVEGLPLNSKEKKTLEGRLSAERLAKKSTAAALSSAKRIAEMEMERGASRQISDEVKLDLALAAINNKNFAFAEYFLTELFESKNARVKAAAYNALGVVALRDNRVPEAVAYFKESLKVISSYKPALLNLGFAALKGGDIDTAKRAFSSMQDDWFVQYGMISVARLEGQDKRADELCDRVLKKEPGHKAALFNCGLHEHQANRDYNKARSLLEKSGKARGGEPGWDEQAFRMITQVSFEQSAAKQDAAKKKAAEGGKDKGARDKKSSEGKGNAPAQEGP
jgi:tetratricopeptide (TPR) repeat protein